MIFVKVVEWILNFFDAIDAYFFRDCSKNRHEWFYSVRETGRVYLKDDEVPSIFWQCIKCGKRKSEIK